MYLATEETLLAIVRDLPEQVRAPLLVGHNPGLHNLVLDLAGGGAERDRIAHKFPTAALARIDLPAEHWADVAQGSGKLAALILPRELD